MANPYNVGANNDGVGPAPWIGNDELHPVSPPVEASPAPASGLKPADFGWNGPPISNISMFHPQPMPFLYSPTFIPYPSHQTPYFPVMGSVSPMIQPYYSQNAQFQLPPPTPHQPAPTVENEDSLSEDEGSSLATPISTKIQEEGQIPQDPPQFFDLLNQDVPSPRSKVQAWTTGLPINTVTGSNTHWNGQLGHNQCPAEPCNPGTLGDVAVSALNDSNPPGPCQATATPTMSPPSMPMDPLWNMYHQGIPCPYPSIPWYPIMAPPPFLTPAQQMEQWTEIKKKEPIEEKPKRVRSRHTEYQTAVLHERFKLRQFAGNPKEKAALAELIGLTSKQVETWFQNQRHRIKEIQMGRRIERTKGRFSTISRRLNREEVNNTDQKPSVLHPTSSHLPNPYNFGSTGYTSTFPVPYSLSYAPPTFAPTSSCQGTQPMFNLPNTNSINFPKAEVFPDENDKFVLDDATFPLNPPTNFRLNNPYEQSNTFNNGDSKPQPF